LNSNKVNLLTDGRTKAEKFDPCSSAKDIVPYVICKVDVDAVRLPWNFPGWQD